MSWMGDAQESLADVSRWCLLRAWLCLTGIVSKGGGNVVSVVDVGIVAVLVVPTTLSVI
jgi:hypothetical protein